jgi:hypothetical protein
MSCVSHNDERQKMLQMLQMQLLTLGFAAPSLRRCSFALGLAGCIGEAR